MLQVAAYCRVSTDKEDQANSFEAQQRYFREYIQRQPDWELQGIYADEGFSGTSTNKRVEFNKMLHAAELGQIDLIVTKEVSRFTRNTVDALQITRELRRRGVGVLFLNDSLDTRTNDGELRLTIMSSFAQDESRRTSERSKWGQMRSMEKGVVFGGSLLGYDVIGGKMTVNPEGAEVVRPSSKVPARAQRVQHHRTGSPEARDSQQQGQLPLVVCHRDKDPEKRKILR